MAKIQLKKSNVAGKEPAVGDLDYGELALNYADGKLFYKNSSNLIKLFGLKFTSAPATSGTLTINIDNTDIYSATGLTGAITLAQPSATSPGPYDGQRLVIRLEDDGTARGITWTESAGAFRAVGVTLPTTTVAGKVLYIGCIRNNVDSYWDVIAVAQQA